MFPRLTQLLARSSAALIASAAVLAAPASAAFQSTPGDGSPPAAVSSPSANPAAESSQPALDLRPRYIAGQEHRYIAEMHQRTAMQTLDIPRVRVQEYTQRIRFKRKVLEVSDSGATIEVVYEAASVNLVAGNKSMTFDTEGMNDPEADHELGERTRNAIGRPFTVKVDQFGRVQSIAGNENEGGRLAAVNLISEEVLTRALAPIYGLGKEPAATVIGDAWTFTRTTAPKETGSFDIVTDYRLATVSGEQAFIDVNGSMKLNPSEKARAGNASLDSHIVAGQQVWNVLAGVIDRAVYRQEMTITADVDVKRLMEEEAVSRRRRVETVLFVNINRIDDGVPSLPPIPAALHPTPAPAPPRPPAPVPAAPASAPAPAAGSPAPGK